MQKTVLYKKINAQTTNDSIKKTRYKILVVDDDSTTSLLLFETFARVLGHEVTCVSSGKDALEVLSNNRFDVILMDIEMPELDGYQTSHHIRTTNALTPIIAITGSLDNNLNARSKECGINATVLKPFNIYSLSTIIGTLIEATELR